MALALTLGRRGLGNTWPNPAVGAVIVEGRRHCRPRLDASRAAARTPRSRRCAAPASAAQGATMYVTLEPCSHQGKTPPCADAIVKAGIARVVSAMEDPNPEVAGKGHERLRDKGIAVEIGLGADEARRAHAGHIARITQGRPHVLLKLAVSADGKAGLARAQAGRDHRRGGARRACSRCARRATPSWSASAPCCPTIRN